MFSKGFFTYILIVSFILNSLEALSQRRAKETAKTEIAAPLMTTPKLVVGIVVDQMRYDYLTRFWNHYGDDGFKRLVNEGFNCKNNHFNYAPTSTGPGHASVYTGATPATHGIIGNNWYDKEIDKLVYCASDESYETVGMISDAGKMSPHRMTVTTITDQLRLHTQMKGKVIAVALKDRGAVLPGGHTANAAYWFLGGGEGKWISSTYYMESLPKWVVDFNSSNSVQRYKKPWNTIEDITTYVESSPDNNSYEGRYSGESAPVFPHDLPGLWDKNSQYEILKVTPFGNSITTDFALEALKGEQLGTDDITDFLAISYSSTDYVGHWFGVNSKEIQDTYIRLDRDLERLFKYLDTKVGKGEYTVFLTADHGAINVPAYLNDQKIPAGYLNRSEMQAKLAEFIKYKYGSAELIKNYSNNQLFLDHKVIQNLDLSLKEVQETLADELLSSSDMARVYTAYQMRNNEYTSGIPYIIQNGYNMKRSGDVLMVPKPGSIDYSKTGSTHGSAQIYDTHTPLLFYGKGIKAGSTSHRTEIPDIAPTIATMLGIAFPNGTTGKPITAVLE
ncbi:alkaline phosphatase PafA [uncultured Eudoraea sp.]|uniref:alkaline phosphatase PafA n=1 Tax=uncultured Eudoraea sp. TaxID=1035614 RepID=UPI0026382228|nr:alkaline phosphatase PafA [uncultured Eudoraea sp.]